VFDDVVVVLVIVVVVVINTSGIACSGTVVVDSQSDKEIQHICIFFYTWNASDISEHLFTWCCSVYEWM